MSYKDYLKESAESAGNVVCMGLDPVLSVLPYKDLGVEDRITRFAETLLSEMKKRDLRVAAFKPNIGYYSKLDNPLKKEYEGSNALANVITLIRDLFPSTPIILDSKRGDIARSSANYADEAFDSWKADAVTVSPYMGSDSVMPFAKEGKGVYILNRTSNPGGAEVQNRTVIDPVDEHTIYPLYIAISHVISSYSEKSDGIGAVVGATNMIEFEAITKYYAEKDIPMLIPGVGNQGGSASLVMNVMKKNDYDIRYARINSSSALTHPWKIGDAPENWLDMCISNISNLLKEASL